MKDSPAFPTQMWDNELKEATWIDGGLTKREYFAGQLLSGILSNPRPGMTSKQAQLGTAVTAEVASLVAIEYADALIEALEKSE